MGRNPWILGYTKTGMGAQVDTLVCTKTGMVALVDIILYLQTLGAQVVGYLHK